MLIRSLTLRVDGSKQGHLGGTCSARKLSSAATGEELVHVAHARVKDQCSQSSSERCPRHGDAVVQTLQRRVPSQNRQREPRRRERQPDRHPDHHKHQSCQGTERHHLTLCEVRQSGGSKDERQANGGESQQQTEVQPVEDSHEELVDGANGCALAFTDEEVVGDVVGEAPVKL